MSIQYTAPGLFTINCIETTKIKKKEAGRGLLKKHNFFSFFYLISITTFSHVSMFQSK